MTAPLVLGLLAAGEIDALLDETLGKDREKEQLRHTLHLVFLAALAGAGWVARQLAQSILLTERDQLMANLAEHRERASGFILETTRDRVRRVLTDVLNPEESDPAIATASPQSTAEPTKAGVLAATRGTFAEMRQRRAAVIALCCAGGAWEAGATREMQLQGVPARMWVTQRPTVTQRASGVRPSHASLDGQCRRPDNAFRTVEGAAIRYPRDPEAALEEQIGCLCVTSPLAHGCDPATHLASEPDRLAYWRATTTAMVKHRAAMAREVRRALRLQGEAVLNGLRHRLR